MIDRERMRELCRRKGLLKVKLQKTDYMAIKYAEGELSTAEYAAVREQRRAWRAEINALEAEIATLKA